MNNHQKMLETLGRQGADIGVLAPCSEAALEEFLRVIDVKEAQNNSSSPFTEPHEAVTNPAKK